MKSVHQVAYEILRTHGMTTVFGNPQRRDQGTFAREVCRVVRAAHAGVVRDLWIGTEWPCHVDTVVSDSRCDQSIGCDSGLAPRSSAAIQFTWSGPGPPPQCSMPGT